MCSPEFPKRAVQPERRFGIEQFTMSPRAMLYLIALDPHGVQDKYSSSECGIGSGSIRECGFGLRAFLSL